MTIHMRTDFMNEGLTLRFADGRTFQGELNFVGPRCTITIAGLNVTLDLVKNGVLGRDFVLSTGSVHDPYQLRDRNWAYWLPRFRVLNRQGFAMSARETLASQLLGNGAVRKRLYLHLGRDHIGEIWTEIAGTSPTYHVQLIPAHQSDHNFVLAGALALAFHLSDSPS